MTSPRRDVLSVGQTLGAYQILAKLGEGGMGEVYRARDTKLNRDVALKFLTAEYTQDAERVRRFKQEATTASGLNHPNILTIHDASEARGQQYIATEFVDGETLRQILRRSGSLPVAEALAIATQIASALAAAHRAGIVHRDIKPENVMVRRDGYVKVLDFGIAKLAEPSGPIDANTPTHTRAYTQDGAIVGTLPYMSPEQARGSTVDGRTDIWSLGCLLYEMLAGRQAFVGETTTDLLVAILEKEPAALTQLAPQVPADFDWIVGKALRKSPGERYQTTEELGSDLRRLQQKLDLESHHQRVLSEDDAVGKTPGPSTSPRTAGIDPSGRSRVTSRLAAITVSGVLVVAVLAAAWYWRQRHTALHVQAHSLAVLPLKSLDRTEDYLGLGIADAVIRKTSQTGELIVRPISAVRRYMNDETDAVTAGRQQTADVVLEGSVQRAGDRLRVSVNLLRTADGGSIWADSFDMRLGSTDIFDIQDTVAQQVASNLRLKLDSSQQARLARRFTTNPVAYEFYLKGLHHFDQRMSMSEEQQVSSIEFFRKAVQEDPGFALGHAQLAFAYATVAVFSQATDDTMANQARSEIARAQALDPELAEVALARYQLLFSRYEGFNVAEAVRVVLAAQRLDPNVGHAELAYLYSHLGLPDLGERAAERALEIDPTSEYAKGQLLAVYEYSGQFDRWREAYQRFESKRLNEPWYLLATGRLEEAQRAIGLADPAPQVTQAWLLPAKALLAGMSGDSRAAEAMIPAILKRYVVKDPFYHHASYVIAAIYATEGKNKDAIKWLKEAVATGFSAYPYFEHAAFFDRMRNEPEFVQFMAELKATTDRYHREFESAK